MTPYLTTVRLHSVRRRRRVWLRFGHPISEMIRRKRDRQLYFAPQSLFSIVRWHGNEYGTTLWHVSILRAVNPLEVALKVADVEPGADVLLRVSGKINVRRVLALIQRIEAKKIDPATANPHYWRTVQNRLIARDVIPEYGPAEHAAYLTRVQLTR